MFTRAAGPPPLNKRGSTARRDWIRFKPKIPAPLLLSRCQHVISCAVNSCSIWGGPEWRVFDLTRSWNGVNMSDVICHSSPPCRELITGVTNFLTWELKILTWFWPILCIFCVCNCKIIQLQVLWLTQKHIDVHYRSLYFEIKKKLWSFDFRDDILKSTLITTVESNLRTS